MILLPAYENELLAIVKLPINHHLNKYHLTTKIKKMYLFFVDVILIICLTKKGRSCEKLNYFND